MPVRTSPPYLKCRVYMEIVPNHYLVRSNQQVYR